MTKRTWCSDDSHFLHGNIFLLIVVQGHEVVIIKGGTRACGTGGALTTAPLVQSKSYFEVKIQQAGQWSVGLATKQVDLNKPKGGQDKESWCLCSDNVVYHNGVVVHRLVEKAAPDGTGRLEADGAVELPDTTTLPQNLTGIPQEGDTIGVSFDHIELNFYLNGKNLEVPVHHVRGAIYPALFVDEGAILDIILDNFNYQPPPGFDRIMIEQSLL